MTRPDRWRDEEPFEGRADEVDVLDQLRAANPVLSDDVPDADSPHARALYQEIVTMTSDTTPARPARRYMLAGAAATVVALAAATGIALSGGNTPDPAPQATGDPGLGAGPGMAMCAEVYSLETLPNREVAFDGTLVAVDGDRATFEVNEVFKGDVGETITMDGAETIAASESLSTVGGPGLAVGDRALVSGSDGFVWGCGFTMPYEEPIATQWRDTLG